MPIQEHFLDVYSQSVATHHHIGNFFVTWLSELFQNDDQGHLKVAFLAKKITK